MKERSRAKRNPGKALRWACPFLISAALLAWVLRDIDIAAVASRLTTHVLLHFGPALAAFLLSSLLIEALCLQCALHDRGRLLDVWTAARVKAASYPLGLLNYALGAGALIVLLRRRARLSLAEAAGSVLLISLFDLGSLLAMVLIGVGLLGTRAPGVQAGVVLFAALAIALGLMVLRAPFSLGMLDRVRDLPVLRAARTLPVSSLVRLATMRFSFVALFIALVYSILAAFDVFVPLSHLVLDVAVLLLVAALPIAAAGLGTGQIVFIALFERWADAETLLAASLTLSLGLICSRVAMGLFFAREFTSEALAAARTNEGMNP